MNPRCALAVMLAVLAMAAALAGCGGGDSSAPTDTAPATATAQGDASSAGPGGEADESGDGQRGGGGSVASDNGGSGPGAGDGSGSGEPSPAATKPPRAPGQRTLPSGVVQSLPPSPVAREEALENTYGSIKAFGTEAAPGAETTAITGALQGYLAATAAGDWAAACSLLSSTLGPGLRKYEAAVKAPNPGCPQILEALMANLPATVLARQAKIDVAEVRIDGDRGFVVYATPESVSVDMPMLLEGGAWKVGAIEAYAL
jgi:hypothetical protein